MMICERDSGGEKFFFANYVFMNMIMLKTFGYLHIFQGVERASARARSLYHHTFLASASKRLLSFAHSNDKFAYFFSFERMPMVVSVSLNFERVVLRGARGVMLTLLGPFVTLQL